MRSEKWLKPLVRGAVLLTVIAIAVVALVIYEFYSLKNLDRDLNAVAKVHSDQPVTQQEEVAPTPASTPAPAVAPAPTPAPSPHHSSMNPLTTYLVDRFAARSGPDVDVCNMLSATDVVGSRKASVRDIALGNLVAQEPSTNSGLESSFIPTARLLQLPGVAKVALAFKTASETGDMSVLRDPSFSSAIASATAETIAHQDEISRAAQHAYHLYALARAVALVPQLGTDPGALDICSHEQNMSRGTDPESMAQLNEEKVTLLRLIATAGLTPQAVDFDPYLVNAVTVELSASGVTENVPWLTNISGPQLEITSPIAAPPIVSGTTSPPK